MKKSIKAKIKKTVELALREDVGNGDITTQILIAKRKKSKGIFLLKKDGVVCGLEVADMVFKKIDKKSTWHPLVKEGARVKAGTIIAEVKGSARTLLAGERTALNFLQRMSGIATLTAKYVEKVKGTKAQILDTRKTAPGLRHCDKYAVQCGGGTNHRMGLYDQVLIKDNHIKAVGSITQAVKQIKKQVSKKIKIEVETSTRAQIEEALKLPVDVIMLDNMSTKEMKEAVALIQNKCKVEASGGVNLNTLRAVAETGVDYVSVGALTHSVPAVDISMKIE